MERVGRRFKVKSNLEKEPANVYYSIRIPRKEKKNSQEEEKGCKESRSQ